MVEVEFWVAKQQTNYVTRSALFKYLSVQSRVHDDAIMGS